MSHVTYQPLIRDGVRLLLDLTSGRLIVPLVGAKGDTTIPPPTPQETALQAKQLELINQQQAVSTKQQAEQDALAPYLYSQMGLKKVSSVDPSKLQPLQKQLDDLTAQQAQSSGPMSIGVGTTPGNPKYQTNRATAIADPAYQARQSQIADLTKQIKDLNANPTTSFTAMTDAEKRALMSPQEQQSADIQTLANTRTQKALEGNLNVDPSVEADISRGEGQLRAELMRKLGPGAEGSDSWNRAMSEYNRNMDSVRYSVRHGEMTSADAIATNRSTEQMRRQDQALNNLKTATDPYSMNASTLAGTGNAVAGGISNLYGQRVNAADMSMQNTRNTNAFWGQIIGSGLGAGGMAAGCWIAEALYGMDAPETHLLRYWLNRVWATRSFVGRVVMRLYGWQGQRVAGWVRRSMWVRRLVQPVFDCGLKIAQRELREGGHHG